MRSPAFFAAVILTCSALVPVLRAAERPVDTVAALQAALGDAMPGDTIVVKAGVYTTAQPLTINRVGTAEQPITITADTTGAVEITGSHGFTVASPAAYVVIAGFRFTHKADTTQIDEGTSQVRLSRNTFLCVGDGPYLTISGDDAQIDYNEFGAKKTPGNMIAVAGTGSQVARRLWIHHNYFHDLANAGTEGAQMLRLGLMSAHGGSTGACLIEHNLFAGCRGVSELVSNRSSGNTYRYNTFVDSPTSQLTLRQGNETAVYGNFFRNTEGIRIYGDRHRIFSNYFESNHIAIGLGNGAPDPTDGTPNKNERPDDCVIVFNTFVENTTHYTMSKRNPDGLGATNTVFAYNVLQGGTTAARIAGPNSGAVWTGNILWQVGKAGDVPTSGFTQIDPQLVAGADEIKRPQAGSPVLGAAAAGFPEVVFDLDGQPRPEKKSIGADEPGDAGIVSRWLTPADVGPLASETPAARPTTPAPAPVPPSDVKVAPAAGAASAPAAASPTPSAPTETAVTTKA